MQVNQLNDLAEDEARQEFSKCCSANRWIEVMVNGRPYSGLEDLVKSALDQWAQMEDADILQAFDGHPKIGDLDSLKQKYYNTHAIAADEQSGVQSASDQTIEQLAHYNALYESKFGFIFIVCATGKSVQQMLEMIRQRLNNDRKTEMVIAANEQAKIIAIRINKLIEENV